MIKFLQVPLSGLSTVGSVSRWKPACRELDSPQIYQIHLSSMESFSPRIGQHLWMTLFFLDLGDFFSINDISLGARQRRTQYENVL